MPYLGDTLRWKHHPYQAHTGVQPHAHLVAHLGEPVTRGHNFAHQIEDDGHLER